MLGRSKLVLFGLVAALIAVPVTHALAAPVAPVAVATAAVHSAVLLQATAPANPLFLNIVLALVSIVVPAIATWGAMQISKLVPFVSNLPSWEMRILVVVENVIMVGIGHALKLPNLPTLITGIDPTTLQLILSTGVTYLVYRLFTGNPPPTTARR